MLEEDCLIRDSDDFAIAPESIQAKGMAIDCSVFPLEEVAEEVAEEEEEEEMDLTWAIYAGIITAGAVVFVLCLYQLSNLCCKYKRWEDQDKGNSDEEESSDQGNKSPAKKNQVGNVPQTDVSTVPT